MQYGYFDDANREYVITRPDTPLPWINYLGSQAYFGLISNTAGDTRFTWMRGLRRLTATVITTPPPTPVGGTCTCAITTAAYSGPPPGSLPATPA